MDKKIFRSLCSMIICLSLLLLYPIGNIYSQTSTPEGDRKEISQQVSPPLINTNNQNNPETLFKEAQKIKKEDPMLAIELFRRGLIFKQDAWEARRQLAEIYETQNQLHSALLEYEVINRATGSYESYADLIRMGKKMDSLSLVLGTAKRAYEKFPEKSELLFTIGETIFKMQNYDEALSTLKKYLNLKPDDGNALFIVGKIYDIKKDYQNAVVAYLKAKKYLREKELDSTLKGLLTNILEINGISIIKPEGFYIEGKKLISIDGTKTMEISVHENKEPAELFLHSLKEVFPPGFISEKTDLKEFTKKGGNEQVPNMVLSIDDYKHIKGAKIAFASICKTCPGIPSYAMLAVPKDKGKVYLFSLRSIDNHDDLNKMLDDFIKYIIWQTNVIEG